MATVVSFDERRDRQLSTERQMRPPRTLWSVSEDDRDIPKALDVQLAKGPSVELVVFEGGSERRHWWIHELSPPAFAIELEPLEFTGLHRAS